MKKLVSILMTVALVVCLFAVAATAETAQVKVGFIFLHDENSTYDLNFINAAKEACEKLGVDPIFKTASPRARSATRPRWTWWTPAATSSSLTALATRIT